MLRSKELVPRQKFTIPMTANQEIGWFTTQMVSLFSVISVVLSFYMSEYIAFLWEIVVINANGLIGKTNICKGP